jgi:hypothetical protein
MLGDGLDRGPQFGMWYFGSRHTAPRCCFGKVSPEFGVLVVNRAGIGSQALAALGDRPRDRLTPGMARGPVAFVQFSRFVWGHRQNVVFASCARSRIPRPQSLALSSASRNLSKPWISSGVIGRTSAPWGSGSAGIGAHMAGGGRTGAAGVAGPWVWPQPVKKSAEIKHIRATCIGTERITSAPTR